jgi:3-deoxy-D-manno-octulosonic-acid transferase
VQLIYNIGIGGYNVLIFIVSFFSKKARLWRDGRKDWATNLKVLKNEKVIWIHAASLGEFEQGKPIIDKLFDEDNGCKILLTFFSPSGYEVRKDYEKADVVMYLPIDSPKSSKKFIDLLDLEMAVFIKYEFWFNFLKQLKLKKVKTVFISVIFREDQMFFSWWGKWFLNHLKNVSHFFVQNHQSESILNRNDISAVQLTGDTRFDAVCATQKLAKKNELIEQFIGTEKCVIFGSTWDKDHDLIIPFINNYKNGGVKFIIAPHEMKTSELNRLTESITSKVVNYLDGDSSGDVMIINTIGILKHLYQYAIGSYIGGGFGTGIHNTLEAAVQNQFVVFGPIFHKFQEAKDLIEHDVAVSITNQLEFDKALNKLIDDVYFRNEVSEKSKIYIELNIGASEKIMKYINQHLKA